MAPLVVHQDGMIPTTDEIHAVFAINRHPCHVSMRVARRQLFPSLNGSIGDGA
jgi:acyl dehydratase